MLGSMTSLTGGGGLQGGSAGPSTAKSTTNNRTDTRNESGYKGGSVYMGSHNGIPTWALILGAIGIFYIMVKK